MINGLQLNDYPLDTARAILDCVREYNRLLTELTGIVGGVIAEDTERLAFLSSRDKRAVMSRVTRLLRFQHYFSENVTDTTLPDVIRRVAVVRSALFSHGKYFPPLATFREMHIDQLRLIESKLRLLAE